MVTVRAAVYDCCPESAIARTQYVLSRDLSDEEKQYVTDHCECGIYRAGRKLSAVAKDINRIKNRGHLHQICKSYELNPICGQTGCCQTSNIKQSKI
jgi:hypothetical protein